MSDITSNSDRIDALLQNTGAGEDTAEKLRQEARRNPAVARVLGQLTDSDIAGIAAILSDKQALARIMSAPKARAILKKLGK